MTHVASTTLGTLCEHWGIDPADVGALPEHTNTRIEVLRAEADTFALETAPDPLSPAPALPIEGAHYGPEDLPTQVRRQGVR